VTVFTRCLPDEDDDEPSLLAPSFLLLVQMLLSVLFFVSVNMAVLDEVESRRSRELLEDAARSDRSAIVFWRSDI
jgi:hypothetical protein